MQSPTAQLIAQFTEDARATEDRLCERTDCLHPKIQKGDPVHYIASCQADQRGKLVCDACLRHYKMKNDMSTRKRTESNDRLQPMVQDIRKSVSAAQSRSSTHPPSVVPISQRSMHSIASGSMPPPPIPSSRLQASRSHGPNVHVASAWPIPKPDQARHATYSGNLAHSPSGPSLLSGPSMGAFGYGPQHSQYLAHRQHWASMAQHPAAPAQTYSLNISAVYESGMGKRGAQFNNFGSIREGLKDIDALSTAHDLVGIALSTLVPLIKAYCSDFAWREAEFVVRDKEWVNLLVHTSTRPYFYDNCLHDSTRKNSKAKVFKSGKQFLLYVVVPEKQWEELEEFRDKAAMGSVQSHSAKQLAPRARRSLLSLRSRASSPTTTHRRARRSLGSLRAPSSVISTFPSTSAVQVPQPITDDLSSDSDVVAINDVSTTTISKRRHHHDSSASDSSGSTHSPPQKKSAPSSLFTSPNRNQLKHALQSGGKIDLDVKSVLRHKIVQVDFYPIPARKLDDLINELHENKAAFDIKTAKRFGGHMRVEATMTAATILGVGAFKTAQTVDLTLSPLRPTGLGSTPNQLIVAKRPFLNPSGGIGRPPYIRLSVGDESKRLYREANVLYWAIALLDLVYDYIDQCVADAAQPPPFKIPRLRFVEAGLLFAYTSNDRPDADPVSPESKPTTVGITYLAEEVIHGEFFKYIHNGNASPRRLGNAEANEIAQFLSFTQHVQYTKTGGQVYISDYQGSITHLTDPQLLTHPDVSGGANLFGDGNVEAGVELFKEQHSCSANRYCSWPGFKLKSFQASSGSKGAVM